MNQKVKNNKDKDKNNSSNSLVFGQWLQTKIAIAMLVYKWKVLGGKADLFSTSTKT